MHRYLSAIAAALALTVTLPASGLANPPSGPAIGPAHLPTFARQNELEDLAWPLLVAGVEGCLKTHYLPGLDMFADPSKGMYVRHVVAGSPSDGLISPGAIVTSVNGESYPADAVEAASKWIEEKAEREETDTPLTLVVNDGFGDTTVTIQPQQVCYLPMQYMAGAIPTFENGDMMVITAQFDELAPEPWMAQAQIAHQLGHLSQGHAETRGRFSKFANIAQGVAGKLTGFGGTSLDGFLGSNLLFGKKHELEADRIALELTTAINLDPEMIVDYWATIIEAKEGQGKGFKYLSKHPSHPERIDAMRQQVQAMEAGSDAAMTGGETSLD